MSLADLKKKAAAKKLQKLNVDEFIEKRAFGTTDEVIRQYYAWISTAKADTEGSPGPGCDRCRWLREFGRRRYPRPPA